jgi:hypothetical protein
MNASVKEKIRNFDENGRFKVEIDRTMTLLRSFRKKYPFLEKSDLIDNLTTNDIFTDSGDVGDFFHWIEYHLKPIGHLYLFSKVYRNIRSQLDDFKSLLYIVVDKSKSLAEKVDANWEEITGMGGDKHIAKKIIFCFNYETNSILPIFKTRDLEFFYRNVTDSPYFPDRFSRMSLGEKYQFLNSELIRNKERLTETRQWELPYFSRFLYETFPPPRGIAAYVTSKEKEKIEQRRIQQRNYRNFVDLLNQLRSKNAISAVERRSYEEKWRTQPDNRDSLMKELECKLGKQSKNSGKHNPRDF